MAIISSIIKAARNTTQYGVVNQVGFLYSFLYHRRPLFVILNRNHMFLVQKFIENTCTKPTIPLITIRGTKIKV